MEQTTGRNVKRSHADRSKLARLRIQLCGDDYTPAYEPGGNYEWFVGPHSVSGARAVIAWHEGGFIRPSHKSPHMNFWFFMKDLGLVRLAEVFLDCPDQPGELHHATIAIRTDRGARS